MITVFQLGSNGRVNSRMYWKIKTKYGGYGYYSVVTTVDPPRQKFVIVDPYQDFRSQDRIFTFEFFMSRWWDTNNFSDPETGNDNLVDDRQMLFEITPDDVTFPLLLDIKKKVIILEKCQG